jgi:hypothetical protein
MCHEHHTISDLIIAHFISVLNSINIEFIWICYVGTSPVPFMIGSWGSVWQYMLKNYIFFLLSLFLGKWKLIWWWSCNLLWCGGGNLGSLYNVIL